MADNATLSRRKKRGVLYWQLQWTPKGGKQQRRSLGRVDSVSKERAELKRLSKESELKTGKPLPMFTGCPLFETHRTKYLTWHAAEYPAGHFRVNQILTQHCTRFEGRPLDTITHEDADLWKVERKTAEVRRGGKIRIGVRGETLRREYSALFALLTKAVEWGHLIKHPWQGMKRPQGTESKPPPVWEPDELQRLYAIPERGPRNRFLVNTGLRRSELLNLRASAVDLKRREITILSREGDDQEDERPAAGTAGKVLKYWVRSSRTKSGKYRTVPMNDEALAAYRDMRRGREDQPFVVPQITPSALTRGFKKDLTRAGLPGSIKWCRSCYCTYLAEAGVPPVTVQQLAGHADIKTTMLYIHPRKEHARLLAQRAVIGAQPKARPRKAA